MTGTSTPVRLDLLLVQRGLARSRRTAAEMVAQGRVRVAGAVADKVSLPVRSAEQVEVEPAAGTEYVSRAAHKLLGALDAIETLHPGAVVVEGAVCLDAGASTGGFTQVLLERGAARVLAVDVGHGQLSPVVAADPRVVVREGLNVRELTTADLVDGRPSLVVADLSFISLTMVVTALAGVVAPGGHLLLMVKPQFEVGRERLASTGVVTSVELRAEAVRGVAAAAAVAGLTVRAVLPSPLPGPSGNHEYFLWLGAPDDGAEGAARPAAVPQAAATTRADRRVPDAVARAVTRAVRDGQPAPVDPTEPGAPS